MSESNQELELSQCRDYLLTNGFGDGAYHVAYPGGGNDANTAIAMKNTGMKTGRLATTQIQQGLPIFNPYQLQSYEMNYQPTPATVLAFVDSCIANQTTANLCFHDIRNTISTMYDYSIPNFQTVIDGLVSRGIKCLNIVDWWNIVSGFK